MGLGERLDLREEPLVVPPLLGLPPILRHNQPEVLRPHPPSVQGPDGLVWAGQRWSEAEILVLRIQNRKRFGSTENPSVEPTLFRLNRHYFG